MKTSTSIPAPSALLEAPVEDRLAAAIGEIVRQAPDRLAIVAQAGSDARRAIDYGTLAQAIAALEAALDAARPVGIVARATRVESLVVISAACGRQHVPVAFLADDSRDLVGELRDWVELDDSRGQLAVLARRRWSVLMGSASPQRIVKSPMFHFPLPALHHDTPHAARPTLPISRRVGFREVQVVLRHP
jgi:hypothetical protein